MQSGSVAVKVGQKVSRGEMIGKVGASGQAAGYHLHFTLSTVIVSGSFNNNVDTISYDYTSSAYHDGTSTGKPDKTKDMSVDDYMTYYAQSVTSFSGTATPKSGTLKLYRLPETLNNTVSYTTTTGSVKLVRKIVNSAGNTWYETSTGAFAYSGDITIVESPTINDLNLAISKKGTKPYISANIGYSSTNKPKSWTLAYGTTTALGTTHTEKFTDSVLSAYNPVPISVQFGTEEPELRYNTTYYYRLSVTPQSGGDGSVEGHFTTDKCTNHTWDSGTVTTQPICCTDGVKTFKCTNPGCGETKTEAIPRTRDHKWNSGAVTKQPTCVATGIKTYTCTTSGCGATTTETVAATGKHTWDSGAVTTPAKPGEAGVKTYTCTVCKQTKTESIPALPLTYTVSYDANGGSGAPASQTKTHDETLTLSAARPTRDGCTFLGWATDKTATSAQYQPGDSYTANADAALYAVWEENAPSIEEQLRAAIANGESEFRITGDCVLSADITVPDSFVLYVEQGTFTVPNGVTLTIAGDGCLASIANTAIQSGGKIVNNGTINSCYNGDVTIENGGALENEGIVSVYSGGTFHNNGTYTSGDNSFMSFDMGESDLAAGLTGVDLSLVTLRCWSGNEADIRSLFAQAKNAKRIVGGISEEESITLTADLTLPKNGSFTVNGELIVPQGVTFTNNGAMTVNRGCLVIESGAKLVNTNVFRTINGAQLSVAGTFENTGWGDIDAKGWNCTGTLIDDEDGISLFAKAATAEEIEAVFQSGATLVCVSADITLDRSITVPRNAELHIESGGKLTVPASYTLTCYGTVIVAGSLEVSGTYEGGKVQVYQNATLTGDNVPHQKQGMLAEQITITGADSVQPGSSTQYDVEILPDNAWETAVEWSIVSGKGLAEIDIYGNLTAGDTAGEITIRATAYDGSEVYGEKTVTIEGTALSIEEQLRAAIANGEMYYTVMGDVTLSADLALPAGFHLCIEQGALTIREGVYVYVEGGSITIGNGGTLENNWVISVSEGGSFHNNGTYTPGETSDLIFDMSEIDLDTGLTGVDMKLVRLTTRTETEADIRALFAKIGTVKGVTARVEEASITLSDDLTIPTEGFLQIGDNGVLTVPQGKTLTNNSTINMYSNGRLVIEPGATLVNNDTFQAWEGTQVSVAGTFENNGRVTTVVGSWNCTGTLVNDAGDFTVRADVTTAEELEAALKAGATSVTVTENITLDRSITVSENTELNIRSGIKMVVPEAYTLTNNGTILVDGTLEINGTFSGEKIHVYYGGTLTPDTIPHRNAGVTATAITIIGADTVPTGGSTQYSASLFPEDVWETWVRWSIGSGEDLAAITSDGVLTAGDTTGTVTIRADAADGSLIYAEKTVTIGEAALTIEDELRAAIESGKSEFTITGDCTLTRNLDLPDYFVLRQEEGTLTVPNGVTFTVTAEAFFRAASDVVIQSGGKLVNCGTTHSRTNGSITVETGGTVENTGWIAVLEGGGFHNNGTYTPGEDSRLLINVGKCNLETDLTGVDRSLVALQLEASTEAELQTLFAGAGNVREVEGYILQGTSVTLTGDLTIPANGSLCIYGTLTVAQGATLTNNGEIRIGRASSSLVIASGARIVNNNSFVAEDGAQVSMAGTFENTGGANIRAAGWSCTGELVNSGTFLLFFEAATADELEAMLRSGAGGANANVVETTADITLDRSITVPGNMQLNIGFGTKLTVPAPYTLTNEGSITVAGMLEVTGTFSGNPVDLLDCGTLIPEDIPHRDRVVPVTEITITGADTLSPGSHTRYSAETLPLEATDGRVEWSIVSGGDLATMLDDGILLAGASTGEVTIRATAMDGTGVYGEKTVKLEGEYISCEEQLRAAIKNNEEMFEIYGDCTLSADLTVPAGFRLYVQYGTLTVPNGVTLTVAQDGHFYSCSNVVAQSGGKIINNGVLGAFSNGGITVEAGGTLENNWYFSLYYGGTFHNYGTYTPGEESDLYFSDGNYKTDVTGVDWKLLTVESLAQTEEELRTLLENSVNVKQLTARLYGTTAITLSDDLTIPETGCIMLAGESSLTVPAGKTLTNNGNVHMIENARLVIESGAALINNDYIGSTEDTEVSVAGTLESTGWGYVHIDSWHCTGTFVNGGKGIALF